MPEIRAIPAITFAPPAGGHGDITKLIAPPYDVLDEAGKARLLDRDAHNIVAIDLPHLPAKTVGPDATYAKAGDTYRDWLHRGILKRRATPAMFVYQQSYTHGGKQFHRRGLIANVAVQPFGKSPTGGGGIHPHEQTFSGPKEDRMKLMRATKAQLSPIFGLHSDPKNELHALLSKVIDSRRADFFGVSPGDNVRHEVWPVEDPATINAFRGALGHKDIFIADGHHRYTTALNYKNALVEANGGKPLAVDHPANFCLFVLIAMQDPGMIVLPTHRVLGSMDNFTWEKFAQACKGKLELRAVVSKDVEDLEEEIDRAAGPNRHAMGIYCPSNAAQPCWVATTTERDPLLKTHAKQSPAWRDLDVAIVQHLIVEGICQPTFCKPGGAVSWKFPHDVEEFEHATRAPGYQLGLLLRSTPLESVRLVSEAGELMPQKSTFFYPKLATGLVINPLE